MAQIPILSKRSQRKKDAIDAAVAAGVQKAITPALAQAAMQSQMSSGATYAINPSSPFNQVGPGQGFQPLPRPAGVFDSGFGPANPLFPDAIDPLTADGRTIPRRAQYLISANINLIDRRLPWSVLKGLAEDVDIIARCIQLVQDAIVGLDWSWGFSPMVLNQIMTTEGITNSSKANAIAREKYGDELQRVSEFWEYPDKRMGFTFSQWLTDVIFSHLVYDGIVLSPQYNLGGELISLSTIDTPTIKILLDNQGFIPQPPAPAYQQILYGFPRGEYQAENLEQDGTIPNGFQTDQLAYYIRRPHPDSVYGYSQVEECVNIATIYMQRQAWLHSEYSHGVTPRMMMEMAGTETWTPEQLAYYEQIMNDRLSGQTQRRQQMFMLRPGMTPHQLTQSSDIYKADFDEWLVMQMGAKFGIPQSQLGIQMRSSIGSSGQQKGQTDQSQMFATDALKNFLIDCINDATRRFMGVGPELTMTCTGGGDDDDDLQRAQSDASDVNSGIRTSNEIRAERGIPLIDTPEADQLRVNAGPAGVVYLEGTLAAQQTQQELASQPPPAPIHVVANPDGTVPQPNDEETPAPDETPAKPKSPAADTTDNAKPNVTPKDDPRQPDAENETAKELAAFAKWAKTRMGKSVREFEFTTVDPVRAAALNDAVRSGDDAAVKEQLSLAKRDDTPSKAEDTERLNAYWAEGEGAAKIGWGTDGDFDRCRVEVGKYLKPEQVDGHCANLHHRATGFWPGHAPGESESHGKKALVTSPSDTPRTAQDATAIEAAGIVSDRLSGELAKLRRSYELLDEVRSLAE